MNKLIKITLILFLTGLIAVVTLLGLGHFGEVPQSNVVITSKIISTKSKEHKPLRYNESPYQAILEQSILEKLNEFNPEDFIPPPSPLNTPHDLPFTHVSLGEVLGEKNRRLLANKNSLDNPGIIDLVQGDNSTVQYYAYKHVLNHLSKYSSKYIVYPYSFTYTPTTGTSVSFNKGGVLSLDPDSLPTNPSATNYFINYKTDTNVEFGKAKALYNINIAILVVEHYYQNQKMTLTVDANTYCSFLSNYLGQYSSCIDASDYDKFKADPTNNGKMALVNMSPENLDLLLTADGSPRFQLLIVPDHMTGSHQIITDKLKPAGITKVQDFLNKGGFVYAYGRSGYLLELWGIAPTGLYDPTTQIGSFDNTAMVTGCENIDDTTDFEKALLCLNVGTQTFISSAYMMNPSVANASPDLQIYMSYDPVRNNLLKSTEEESMIELDPSDTFLPFLTRLNYGKGKVLLINGNPLYKLLHNQIFYNQLFMAMSKMILFEGYVGSKDGKVIPSGEVGIQFDLFFSFANIFDTEISDVKVHLWLPKGIISVNLPADCSITPFNSDIIVDLSAINPDSHILCSTPSLPVFSKYANTFIVEVNDSAATQAKKDIAMAVLALEYTDAVTSALLYQEIGVLRADASLAALLRGALNPDPSAFYPVRGAGQYIDNVLQLENKEDTPALDVDYVAVIPLITPLLDGGNQKSIARVIRLLHSYYKVPPTRYYFPFGREVEKSFDNLDFKWLNNKNVYLCADWDIPVKIMKRIRNETNQYANSTNNAIFDIVGLNYSTTVDSNSIVLEQLFFEDSDTFFEHATQRLMVFVDTTKSVGGPLRYPDGAPPDEQAVGDIHRTKIELLWLRNDIYFYEANEYQLPEGIEKDQTLTLDRYEREPNTKTASDCIKTLGKASTYKAVKGYFDVEKTDGIKHNEYYNELLMYCKDIVRYEDIPNKFANKAVRQLYYLVPIINEDIKEATDVMHFIKENDIWHLKDYPEVMFMKAHTFTLSLNPEISRQGGKLVLKIKNGEKFKNGKDPIANDFITYSADDVAFYKTTYDSASDTIIAYFKRGLMPDEAFGGPSNIGINIEGLNSISTVSVELSIFEMKYSIFSPSTDYMVYIEHSDKQSIVNFIYDRFFKMPAVEMHVKLNRGGSGEFKAYELFEAFSRIGLYIQELQAHRTIYAYLETHNVNDPGLVCLNGGFASIGNIGISSIPFADYVTKGSGLLIPSSSTTSRVEWTDIWGRRWAQPLRSLFPDIPPIPPPLKNFIMTTTYELTKAKTNKRVLAWNSDEELDIRVQLKFLNNYPKYFEVTTCKDNEVNYFQTTGTTYSKLRIFETSDLSTYSINKSDAPDDKYFINSGHLAKYGACFQSLETVLEGEKLTSTDLNNIREATICIANANPTTLRECINQFSNGVKTVKKRVGITKNGTSWMYSPLVEKYYPENYIKSNMWDMTHYDYDDNPMDKSYKYHCDNSLPGIEYGPPQNPARLKGHNIVSQPIFKGFGYSITYDNTKTLPRFPKYKGWWSDNLQNKDNTLVAGQSKVNDISVDKETLLPDSMWINMRDMKQNPSISTAENIKTRSKNIHTCMFNQNRVKVSIDQQRYAYLGNVHQNNIIPIMPDLTDNDPRYTNFDCTDFYQYSPYNISKVDNRVKTSTIRDYLYFQINLRGGARETINIPYSMAPLSTTKYEGLAKVQDGGRFTYWNPVNGPNSFLIVDDPLNVVEAIRCDLSIEATVMPSFTSTFNSAIYYLVTISDPAEENREWTYETYTNNYGFGDSTVGVFVGGTEDTSSTLDAGDLTYVRITFYNNAGFDWNMYGSAISFSEGYSTPINANDLSFKLVHTIQNATAYNFMKLEIPPEIEQYVNITPSDHNALVAPQFFDFMNINVVTIRDGYKGDYYYKIKIDPNIPESLCGQVYEIKIKFIEEHFDHLPGYNDPTAKNYHDYHLSVPSIKFGIKHRSTYDKVEQRGKVYYTSGYSSKVQFTANIPDSWVIEEARRLTKDQVDQVTQFADNQETWKDRLVTFWNDLSNSAALRVNRASNKVDYTSTTSITVDLSPWFDKFPIKKTGEPDETKVYMLLKATASQVARGSATKVLISPKVKYLDHTDKEKSQLISEPAYRTVASNGAWLETTYTSTIVVLNDEGKYVNASDQRFFAEDKNKIVRVKLTARNIGDAQAYNTNLTVSLGDGIAVIEDLLPQGTTYILTTGETGKNFIVKAKQNIASGNSYMLTFYLKYEQKSLRRLLGQTTSRTFVNKITASINLEDDRTETQVSQVITTPLSFATIASPRETLIAETIASTKDNRPTFHINAIINPVTVPTFDVVRRVKTMSCTDNVTSTTGVTCADISEGTWISVLNKGTICQLDDSPIPDEFEGVVDGWIYEIRITGYSSGIEIGSQLFTLSLNQKEDGFAKEYSLPLYVIILIAVITVLVIVVAVIIIYRKYRLVKVAVDPSATNEVIVNV